MQNALDELNLWMLGGQYSYRTFLPHPLCDTCMSDIIVDYKASMQDVADVHNT